MIGKVSEIAKYLFTLDPIKQYEIREHKEKRTLKQNDYYHTLKNKLSKKTGIPPEEIHREMIFKSCPFEEHLVPEESDLRALEYYEIRSRIERNGKLFKAVRVYVGSSKLDTVEMGILLDNMIEECQLQGIQTITPEELAKMRALERNMK